MHHFILILGLCLIGVASFGQESSLKGKAAELYQKAKGGRSFAEASLLNPEIFATSDGKSFIVVWKGTKQPKHWIVSLHGSEGFATDDFAIWHPSLKYRDVGIVCLQWWLGSGSRPEDYYTPAQAYREVDAAMKKLGVTPGTVMLHGFSRASADSYAVMALDAVRGQHYFSLAVASSGGVVTNYPPTQAIIHGSYGDHPLKGTRWITAAGGKDPNPDRDGIPGMKRTATWLKEQGATIVLSIEDPDGGHGALQKDPANVRKVLDLFLNERR